MFYMQPKFEDYLWNRNLWGVLSYNFICLDAVDTCWRIRCMGISGNRSIDSNCGGL